MDLESSLRRFDGKRTAVLESLEAALPRDEASVTQLLALSEHEETGIQVGATWILKRWHEEGVPQVEASAAHLVRVLKNADHWEARLHLLQILASLRIPTRSATLLQRLLPDLMADDNKLVRAWAISVLVAAADQRAALRGRLGRLLEDAEKDEAASVRARVRQLRRRYKWLSSTA